MVQVWKDGRPGSNLFCTTWSKLVPVQVQVQGNFLFSLENNHRIMVLLTWSWKNGFLLAFPPGGGLSGPNYQLRRAFHDHHQHHECVFSSNTVVVRSVLFRSEVRLLPSLSPVKSRFCNVSLYHLDNFWSTVTQVGPCSRWIFCPNSRKQSTNLGYFLDISKSKNHCKT
jgi:hypothetical protein